MDLAPAEVRVLGCLVEKQATTPQYYPLTLNALVNACNQTSNRNPIVAYDDETVQKALGALRERGLIRVVHSVHNRAIKYRQVADEALGLDPNDLGLLGLLALRGPQTVAELRSRAERLTSFASAEEVEAALHALADRPEPLVVRLARRPGQKEARYAHLLAGAIAAEDTSAGEAVAEAEMRWAPARVPDAPPVDPDADAERVAALEVEVADLREQLDEIRRELADLRRLTE